MFRCPPASSPRGREAGLRVRVGRAPGRERRCSRIRVDFNKQVKRQGRNTRYRIGITSLKAWGNFTWQCMHSVAFKSNLIGLLWANSDRLDHLEFLLCAQVSQFLCGQRRNPRPPGFPSSLSRPLLARLCPFPLLIALMKSKPNPASPFIFQASSD